MTIQDLIVFWNVKYSFDRIYRVKNNIKFGSIEHRNLSPLDMIFELKEQKLFDKITKERIELENNRKDYKETKNPFLKQEDREQDDERMRKLFDDLDISQLNGNE
jgi:ribosomal protein L14E/L6E/L27E